MYHATPHQVEILRSRGLRPRDVVLMRQMWDAGTWEGHEVTIRMLAEIFFTSNRLVCDVVNNVAFKNIREDVE